MKVIFCADPLNNKKVDMDYEAEYNAAKELGLETELIGFEDLVCDDNPSAAVRKIKDQKETTFALYRGWMMRPQKYEKLYNALKLKGIELVNTPESYRQCHYLPESYCVIQNYTAKTIWFQIDKYYKSPDEVYEEVEKVFGNASLVIKDYVKSRKHEWEDACFIPDASDRKRVKRVVDKFIELQGDDLNEGIVFREFLKLEFLSRHSKSKMPLTKEFRIFFFYGKPLMLLYYWDEGDYGELMPDITKFTKVAKNIGSRFFTMDIAKLEDGDWSIVELGDAQVSGLPDNADIYEFYKGIKERLKL
ncbi:MAG TPA: ATP-grasp domain-containing protein [Clostridia bacterium]